MTPPPATAGPPPHPSALAGAAAGVLTAAVAMGVGQLAAGLTVAQSSPVLAVGQAAIDLTPLPVKDFAISTFGANDKNALLAGILVILAAFAAVIGILAVRRLALGLAGLGVFACIGLAAALTRPTATAAYVIPTLVGAAAGAFALTRLVRAAHGLDSRPSRSTGARTSASELKPPDLPGPAEVTPASSFTYLPNPDDRGASRGPARRRFLTTSGVAVVTAAAGALVGRELITRHNVSAARAALRFPTPAVAAPPLPPGTNLNIPGLSSFITPNGSFYRVDTALLLPQVDPATWQLRIHGMVQREVTLTFDQLLRRPLIEDYVTLTCVSDPVGGPYVGNALWLGASLADLIRQARPLGGADQLLCTSVDGFTSGTPLQIVLDGRDALLTVAMNGQALPVEHGFPARMVVPGLYGYVSACKWVTDIEVTTFASSYAYWATRGWSQQGPIRDRVPDRRAGQQLDHRPRADPGGRGGVGAAQGRRSRRGPGGHRAVAAGAAGRGARHRHLAAVGVGVGRHPRHSRARGPGHCAIGYTQTAVQAQPPPNEASGYLRASRRKRAPALVLGRGAADRGA